MPVVNLDICLRVIDILWSCFIVTPLVVFYWSGTWKLLDAYVLPVSATDGVPLLSSYVSLGIGTAIGLSGYLVLPLLSEHVNPQWSVKHAIVSRIFSYIYVFGILNFWRGVWNITDHFVGTDLKWSLVCYAISKLILIALRSVSSCLSSPFIVTKDHRDDFYKTYTLCRSEVCSYISHISTNAVILFQRRFTFVESNRKDVRNCINIFSRVRNGSSSEATVYVYMYTGSHLQRAI